MNDTIHSDHRSLLAAIAHRAMIERGLLPEFSAAALAETSAIRSGLANRTGASRDLRGMPWCSIDNEDSRDLDQLTAAEALADGTVRILVAIADVDDYVAQSSALDAHARHNTSTVYTAATIFPMLPERLSTDLSSLNFGTDRLAIVMQICVAPDGAIKAQDICRATVRNKARLSYNAVAAWLEGRQAVPGTIAGVPGLEENLRVQDRIAALLKKRRAEGGSLDFESKEFMPLFDGNVVARLEASRKNRAKEMIENFMVAANGVVARFLADHGFPSLARVVRSPKRWDRIVAIANEKGHPLPAAPDAKALSLFLAASKAKDPERFPELSLTIIKLLGPGEYVATAPGMVGEGHFGLAVKEYAHSTAPNRRFPDLVTHRLIKAVLEKRASPYSTAELTELGKHCTAQEDAVNKVERQVTKSAAALLLSSRIGETFNAQITGASEKGTWVKLAELPVEGRLDSGREGLDVGDKLRVRLDRVDVERGYIDFERVRDGK